MAERLNPGPEHLGLDQLPTDIQNASWGIVRFASRILPAQGQTPEDTREERMALLVSHYTGELGKLIQRLGTPEEITALSKI